MFSQCRPFKGVALGIAGMKGGYTENGSTGRRTKRRTEIVGINQGVKNITVPSVNSPACANGLIVHNLLEEWWEKNGVYQHPSVWMQITDHSRPSLPIIPGTLCCFVPKLCGGFGGQLATIK